MTRRDSVRVIEDFFKFVRCLKHGATIDWLTEVTGFGPRQVHQWINTVDKVVGVIRVPHSRGRGRWMYYVNRDRLREKV